MLIGVLPAGLSGGIDPAASCHRSAEISLVEGRGGRGQAARSGGPRPARRFPVETFQIDVVVIGVACVPRRAEAGLANA